MFAVDTHKHHGLSTHFGIMGTPTIILFHNSKVITRFNASDYKVERFADFLTYHTGLEPEYEPEVLEEHENGPVPTVASDEPDMYLMLAWIFVCTCAVVAFLRSEFVTKVVNATRNLWWEAREHQD